MTEKKININQVYWVIIKKVWSMETKLIHKKLIDFFIQNMDN